MYSVPASWEAYEILPATGGRKVNHPTICPQHYEYTSFQANDDPALMLVIYTRCERSGRLKRWRRTDA